MSYCLETSLGGARHLRDDGPLVPFSIFEYKKIGKDFGEALGKMGVSKIYFSAYNNIRANENKILLEKNTKKKNLFLPVINNNGISNTNRIKNNNYLIKKINGIHAQPYV